MYFVKHHNGAKFSITVFVLNQPSNYNVCSRIRASLHFSQNTPYYGFLVHVLHSLLGKNQFRSKICVRFQTFSNAEFYAVDTVSDISPQQLHNFHCINST